MEHNLVTDDMFHAIRFAPVYYSIIEVHPVIITIIHVFLSAARQIEDHFSFVVAFRYATYYNSGKQRLINFKN